jgi:predicted lipid-binding transport protein (Tim44 family)
LLRRARTAGWKRVIAVWWLILWRSFVGGILAGLGMGWVVGFVLGFAGIPQSQITITAAIIGWIAGVVVNLVAVQMALKKHYGEFRLAMVPHDASHDSN